MAKSSSYEQLVFELGDRARDRLAERTPAPRSMPRVFKAEDALVAARNALEALEQAMNDEDGRHRQFLASQKVDRENHQSTVMQHKRVVQAIEGRVGGLRKKLNERRAAVRFGKNEIKAAEKRQQELELTAQADEPPLATARENLKRLRLVQLRITCEVEDLEAQYDKLLTPEPGQPGAQAMLAHRRLMALEDEAEAEQLVFDGKMAELNQAVTAKEDEVAAAEDYLDQALFLLGEECYAQRWSDPELAVFYPRIDKVR